jgi:hypothetical protein
MLSLTVSPLSFASTPIESNPCDGAKPYDATITDADGKPAVTFFNYFKNRNCAEMMDTGYNINLPQAGMDVTYREGTEEDPVYGNITLTDAAKCSGAGLVLGPEGLNPILVDYKETDLCPVNVHWHLGAEHRSEGQYDEDGSGPGGYVTGDVVVFEDDHSSMDMSGDRRKMAAQVGDAYNSDDAPKSARLGLQCKHYDEGDAKFTTAYEFKYCKDMQVGQTYEVHWPHSAAGHCPTAEDPNPTWQYQYPFYDGVFCKPGVISLGAEPPFNVNQKVGVQGQVFTIVNSEEEMYQNDDLFHGAWQDDTHWVDVAKYIGSTTGTSRNNEVCSMYSPITWQVDRTCHMVSAQSFDKMCEKMAHVKDDMTEDMHPHGARELVDPEWAIGDLYRKQK